MVRLTVLIFITVLLKQVYAENVLITGGAGFIGFHTAVKLAKDSDSKVVVLDIFDDSYSVDLKKARAGVLKEKDVVVHHGDVCSQQMLDHLFEKYDFSIVIHLAGKEGAAASMSDMIGYTTANSKCLLKLLEVLTNYKDTHLVYASSYSVYGNQDKKEPVSVQDKLYPPMSVYAALKIGMEEMVLSYCLEYQISSIGLRLFSVYGPWGRPDGDIYRITSLVDNNKQVEIYKEDSVIASRDYTYIDDVVNGIVAAIGYKPQQCGTVFNIGSGREPVTMENVHKLVSDELTKKSSLKYSQLPSFEPLLTNADIKYTRTELGYNPGTTIEEGIKSFIKWYNLYHKDNHWKSPDPDKKLQKELHEKRIDYVNDKYLDRLARLRLKYQHYAEANNLPVTKLFKRPKTFVEIKGKKPSCLPLRVHKDHKSLSELKKRCMDIEECVAYNADGELYSHVEQVKDWKSYKGTMYVADIDICEAGITSCYGNCTCKYTGPSQAEFGCEEDYGLIKCVDDKYFCQQLYSPDRPTYKEEEFKIADDIEKRDWYALVDGLSYIQIKDKTYVGGSVAFYPDAAGDVDRLKEACDKTYHCIGFSTDGDMKGMLTAGVWATTKGIDTYTKDFNYCKLDYKKCACDSSEPGVYDCPKHPKRAKTRKRH